MKCELCVKVDVCHIKRSMLQDISWKSSDPGCEMEGILRIAVMAKPDDMERTELFNLLQTAIMDVVQGVCVHFYRKED